LEVEIKFIDEGKATEIWNKIFELLEADKATWDDFSTADCGLEFRQLNLF
jgi:hypothetical protein